LNIYVDQATKCFHHSVFYGTRFAVYIANVSYRQFQKINPIQLKLLNREFIEKQKWFLWQELTSPCRIPAIYDPTMILLMGMCISLTKKPIKPIIAKPIAVAMAIFWNSLRSGFVHRLTSRIESLANCFAGSTYCITWSIFLCGD